MKLDLSSLLRTVAETAVKSARSAQSSRPTRGTRASRPARRYGRGSAVPGPGGSPATSYQPRRDGRPDPGEVVWAWVPYEEDAAQGKDRPVLVIGLEGTTLLALQLTSKDHDRDEEQERRAGRLWMDVGTGDWDSQRRPSEVRVNRLLRLDPDGVRREGGALDRATFDAVVEAARPWL